MSRRGEEVSEAYFSDPVIDVKPDGVEPVVVDVDADVVGDGPVEADAEDKVHVDRPVRAESEAAAEAGVSLDQHSVP